jgi:integrase
MGPIFLGVEGGRMDRYCAERTVKRLVKHAGIDKRISPHSLRHSFITAALDAGVSLRVVQEAASHADPRTTMRYDRARRSLDRHATSSCRRSSLEQLDQRDSTTHHWYRANDPESTADGHPERSGRP